MLAISLLTCVLATACGMSKGSCGDLPSKNVILEPEGCLVGDPDPDQMKTKLYSVNAPFDLSVMEASLDVVRSENIEIQVPEDALSMEFDLDSPDGDADLLVGLGSETESLVSLNPGAGYDLAVLDPEACVPLRGQSLSVILKSWRQPTVYHLEVTCTGGEPEQRTPAGSPPEATLFAMAPVPPALPDRYP